MKVTRDIEIKLIQQFESKEIFSKEDLLRFFKAYEPELKEGTLGWRIYDLKKKNIFKDVKRGIYTLAHKQEF